ncbi:hypothetical protein SELR_pSRC400230 (plasmid) [Selenomonas ruminantium subsp. lactilytica TAM6421]|uniref:Uncharacterized protein n=1 Tax=Selenomonas ruminantium subsp. lactilytica (strain NBRC 103574 / TAM6421) TaxID=927704 RepID=I0GV87_SELRL|nr:hypothetical protein [Selenomonas ruminantium]BAL84674.1 hypothetical protein SELR_pSRC400230 [Selenomonas ruminantium subsp. lactilytica TAM6421]
MYIPVKEQETVIQIDRTGDIARVYSTDATMICKLDKKYERYQVHKQNRKIVGVEYRVDKRLLSWRSAPAVSHMTDEQKKAAGERLKKARQKKK